MSLSLEPPLLSENPVAEMEQLLTRRSDLLDEVANVECRVRELREQIEQAKMCRELEQFSN